MMKQHVERVGQGVALSFPSADIALHQLSLCSEFIAADRNYLPGNEYLHDDDRVHSL